MSNNFAAFCVALALAVAAGAPGALAQDPSARTKPAVVPPLPPARPANIGAEAGSLPVPPVPAAEAAAPPPQAAPQGAVVQQSPALIPAPALPQALIPAAPQVPAPAAPKTPQGAWVAGATGPLPPASRQRMHACGVEWQEMKMAGKAIDRSWRDFAQMCLSR